MHLTFTLSVSIEDSIENYFNPVLKYMHWPIQFWVLKKIVTSDIVYGFILEKRVFTPFV